MRTLRSCCRIMLLGTLFWPVLGQAREPRLEAGAGTVVPLLVGADVGVNLPWRLRVGGTVGIMPGPYVDVINGTVVALGGYDDSTAELIRASLQNSLILGLDLGWRPWERHGFFLGGGMTMATLGGSATTTALVEAVTGTEVMRMHPSPNIDITTTLFAAGCELGWRWRVRGIDLRAEVGVLWAFTSSTSVGVGAAGRESERINREVDAYLNDIYTSYVVSPTVGLWAGWRGL